MNYSIRLMKEEDVLAVANLESACFIPPYPEKEIRYELNENPVSKLYVALIDNVVVGYLDFMITFDSSSITRLCVSDLYRHKGIASALLNKMVETLKKQKDKVLYVTLEVRASNTEAINLYKKNKFEQVTIKKAYYESGEDAIYMVRSLTND
jgi:ribosomal-protein-alanine N-acetyltransferase